MGILGGLLGYYYAYKQTPKYLGTLSFVLSSDTKSGGLNGIASQFGIDLGSGGSNDVFSGDNIITLFNSKKMISKVLFKTIPDNNQLLINLMVQDFKLDKLWKSKPRIAGIYPFTNGAGIPTRDSLINDIYLRILGKSLTVSRPDKKLSVYQVNTLSSNELISCYLTKYLVNETSQFYIETKTRLAKQNLNMLQKEADSIRNILGSSITITASEVDNTFNLNPALQIHRSNIQKNQINTSVLGTAYGEIIKNLELAKINLQKETPLYQVLDEPTLPLIEIHVSKLLYTILGLILASFFTIIHFIIRLKL